MEGSHPETPGYWWRLLQVQVQGTRLRFTQYSQPKVRQGNGRNIPITRDIPIYFTTWPLIPLKIIFEWYFIIWYSVRYNDFRFISSTSLPLTTIPNFASFENRNNSQCAGLIVKRLNRLDDDKSSRVIIKTRLADDRRRVHILKQARFRSNGNAATARYGHRKEVMCTEYWHCQTVRVQPAHRQPHQEKRKDWQGNHPDRTQDYRRCGACPWTGREEKQEDENNGRHGYGLY